MKRHINVTNTGGLAPRLLEAARREPGSAAKERVFDFELDDQCFWVKRFDLDDRYAFKAIHRAISKIAIPAYLRASPAVDAMGAVEREMRKREQFAQAGFAVPDVVHADNRLTIARDIGLSLADELADHSQSGDSVGHDAILFSAVDALARAHENGLCHGRPHLRDMFRDGVAIGFMDFEEEPEAVMPLGVAQARDFWLLMLLVSDQAKLPDTASAALDRYLTSMPEGVFTPLRSIVVFWHRVLAPARKIRLPHVGGDLRRMLAADGVFSPWLDRKAM